MLGRRGRGCPHLGCYHELNLWRLVFWVFVLATKTFRDDKQRRKGISIWALADCNISIPRDNREGREKHTSAATWLVSLRRLLVATCELSKKLNKRTRKKVEVCRRDSASDGPRMPKTLREAAGGKHYPPAAAMLFERVINIASYIIWPWPQWHHFRNLKFRRVSYWLQLTPPGEIANHLLQLRIARQNLHNLYNCCESSPFSVPRIPYLCTPRSSRAWVQKVVPEV